MHKSKSTYFTDLDMSRGNISLVLFREPINPFSGPKQFIMILGGAQCVWRKEIARYEKYELWTRVLSWDEKWIYLVTHFVKADVFVPGEYAMQPTRGQRRTRDVGLKIKTLRRLSLLRQLLDTFSRMAGGQCLRSRSCLRVACCRTTKPVRPKWNGLE